MKMKTVDEYLRLPYTIELRPDNDGSWFVAIKELPGCMSVGDNPEDALTMIHDAQRAWIETALEENIPIPEPRQEEEYSGNLRIRLAKSLHRRLIEAARQEDVSLNAYCSTVLALALGERPIVQKEKSIVLLSRSSKTDRKLREETRSKNLKHS
jgi:antitoxin HicB